MSKKDRAASPVIGVVLMIGVTVILSAIVATAAFSVADGVADSSPQVSIEYDYNRTANTVNISHNGGDDLNTGQLSIVETGSSNGMSITASGSVSAGTEIASGTYESGEDIRIVWETDDGTSSAIIGQSTAP